MHKKMAALILAVVLLLSLSVAVPAQAGTPPTGSCAPGFELHHFHDHMGDHDHHIGLKVDLNQDGYICVKHLSNGRHVHVDNVIR